LADSCGFSGQFSVAINPVFCWDNGSYGSPLMHLLTGATMMGAFFIATDPVTAPSSNLGRLIYGASIGALVYVIRTWGGYPDAVAFAVLLLNLATPLIDHLLQPRTFGHDIKAITWRGKIMSLPSSMRRNALTLAVFAALTTALIAGVYQLTADKIAHSQQQHLLKPIKPISPQPKLQ
jgi:hypothetical protein